jgi:hypothetical protein
VSGGGHGKIFGDAFDEAEKDGLPDFHDWLRGWWDEIGFRASFG